MDDSRARSLVDQPPNPVVARVPTRHLDGSRKVKISNLKFEINAKNSRATAPYSLRSRMHFPFPGNGRFFTALCYFRANDEKFRPPRTGKIDRERPAIRATASPCDPFRPPAPAVRPPALHPWLLPGTACRRPGDAGTRNPTVMENMIMKPTTALLPDNVREELNRSLAALLTAPACPDPNRPWAFRAPQAFALATTRSAFPGFPGAPRLLGRNVMETHAQRSSPSRVAAPTCPPAISNPGGWKSDLF
jgi:hypothetical protein